MNAKEKVTPEHIPPHLVKTFDYINGEGMNKNPFKAVAKLHDDLPIFWNPLDNRPGSPGSWDIIKAEYMREIFSMPEYFTSHGASGFSKLVGETWSMIPLELDPPEHNKYRQFLNPLVSPVAVKKLDAKINQRAEELIGKVLKEGGCEFMSAFGRPFPVTIIMELIGLPKEELDTFLSWEYNLLHETDFNIKAAAAMQIRDYLRELIKRRRANPVEDFISFISTQKLDGTKLSDDECMGIAYLLFVGGLDTVASSLGFHYHYLATHLDKQRALRQNPQKIPNAVEQLLRRFSVVTSPRRVIKDITFHGVPMKSGDWVRAFQPLASMDPAEEKDPFDVDLDGRSRHMAFSFGPHFCMGSHIARRELIVALQKWTTIVPEFSVKSGSPFEVHGGPVFGVEHLELQW